MGIMKSGTKINLEDGHGVIEIVQKLGEGGQGYVYLVQYNGKSMALKWYKKGVLKNPEAFRKNLLNNIRQGAPTNNFLWPLAITQAYDGSFGYIMHLRPQGYYEFSDFLIGKQEFDSIDNMLKAAVNIVDSFRMLHNKGFSYQDLNDGNFFMNPSTGDVLICDNDNVSQFGDQSGVAGKCRYMAPAVVVGRKAPDKRTDQFSLAVVLFLLLIRNHPLEGKMLQSKSVMTEQRQKHYYGEAPVFIADPVDTSNRPVQGIHNNFIRRWVQMPEYIQAAFIKAFSHEVMCEDKMGVTEKEWLKNLLAFRAEVVECPNCGRETRYYQKNMPCVCCKQPIPHYGWLKTPYYTIPIFSKMEIVEAYITDCYDRNESSRTVAIISMNKTRTKAALKNKENVPWQFGNVEVLPNERCIIEKGMKLILKNEVIEIL
ncbi:MAG: serine/threonine-protein kinase [Oscillospiraceae bacterium]